MILKYPTYQYPTQWSICDYFSSCKVVDTMHTSNIFFTKILLLDRGQHEAMSQTKLLHQPAISQQTQNIFSSNNCQTSCCTCSDLFITCLHFCLAPWYLCTCKSFFWYMLACLSTSLKSRHVHVNCSVHADHHDCKVLTNAGTEVEIPTLGRRALLPHLKKKIHFSPHIFILNCYSGWKVCTWCVFDVFRDWNVCQRWLRSAKVKGSCKEKNGHHYLHINLHRSCIIHIVYISTNRHHRGPKPCPLQSLGDLQTF